MLQFFTTKKIKNSFTLIELLVVIAIISLISSVVLASVQDARKQARIAVAKSDMREMMKVIILAQGERGQSLAEITGDTCTDCSCRYDDFESSQCIDDARDSFEKILEAAGADVENMESFIRDPWGTVYLLDENEGETGHPGYPDDCRLDRLKSVGPEKEWGSEEEIRVLIPAGGECL